MEAMCVLGPGLTVAARACVMRFCRYAPSQADVATYDATGVMPSADEFPHVARFFKLIDSSTEKLYDLVSGHVAFKLVKEDVARGG